MRCMANIILLLSGLLFILSTICFADGSTTSVPGSVDKDQSLSNSGAPQNYLPGEQITSPSGKKMRVWSTKGPVPVSRAPEPFEDREKTVLPSAGIVVDTRRTEHIGQRGISPGSRPDGGDSAPVVDSFDVRPTPQRGAH